MARVTNEGLHTEIKLLKQEMAHLKAGQAKMMDDITMIKKTLLDPDEGAIARTNTNTQFRTKAQKTLWSLWVAILGIVGKMIFLD